MFDFLEQQVKQLKVLRLAVHDQLHDHLVRSECPDKLCSYIRNMEEETIIQIDRQAEWKECPHCLEDIPVRVDILDGVELSCPRCKGLSVFRDDGTNHFDLEKVR